MTEVHIKRNYSIPAAIQFMNPGAMWPGAVATKWGSTKWQYLSDGTGQGGGGHGNKIAIFDNWVDGICAQLDLWRTSPNYRNKRFADAIYIWSGHNHVPEYIAHVKARIPGMNEDTIMNDAFWHGPMGLKFLQVQAAHEAGKVIPAPEADWREAQRRVMGGIVPVAPSVPAAPQKKTVKKAAGSVVAGTGAGAAAHQAGLPLWAAFAIGLAIAAAVFLIWRFKK